MTKFPLYSKLYSNIGNLFFTMLFFSTLTSCTVKQKAPDLHRSLIKEDAEILDKRFKALKQEDIDLSGFWHEGETSSDPITLNNQTYADLLDQVKDGVVNIYALSVEEKDAHIGLSPNEILPFRLPLVSDLIDIIPFHVPIPFRTQGLSLGSGVILNSQGYILTNAHVVHNATNIFIGLSETTREIPAKIIGVDPMTDLALLKAQVSTPLAALALGHSDDLRVGEQVVAIGNPMGLSHTLTTGVVSAKGRSIPGSNITPILDFLQTDSAINPGSSGGPLIDLNGQVIGINTAVLSEAQLVGFAIPIDTVKEILPILVLGKSKRGWSGASGKPMTIADANRLDYDHDSGFLIDGIDKNSPAQKAGLRIDDILIEFDHIPLDNYVAFRRRLLSLMPEEEIDIVVFREGKKFGTSLRLEQKPDDSSE